MSVPVIGLENMPNVYFSSVSIENDVLDAKLTTKDLIDNPTWSESEILRGRLNIKILALCYNEGEEAEKLSKDLKNGTTSIHDISGYPTRVLAAQEYIPAETLQTDTINNFYYNFKLTSQDLDFSKQNIYVFAIAYIDLTGMNLNYAQYKFLDGPMVSEAARDNGRTPIRGTLFRLEDGSIWKGPVHEHQGNYMEGSFHKEEPHADLTEEQVESKVSAFMLEVNEGIKQLSDTEQVAPQFEEFYHYEQELDTSIVVIDTSNLALNEFETARELFNTNEVYFYELMKGFHIPQFELRKAPPKRRLEFMDIGTSDWVYDPDFESVLIKTSMVDGKFDERYEMRFFSQQFNVNPNNLVEATTNAFDITTKSTFESSKKVGYIKELPSNELFLHNLMIVDEEYFSDDSEDYKLKMNIDVIDSFKIELENTKQEMLTLISDLSLTYNGLFGKLDKNRIISFFAGNGILIGDNLNFIRIESDSLFGNSIFSRLSSTLRKVLLSMLSEDRMIQGVIDNTLKNLYINSVSKENYNIVVSFLDNLVNRFITKYNLSSTNNKSVLTNSTISRVERKIQKVIEVNRVKSGNFSFFNKDDNQRIITAADMTQRANEEYNKFFDRAISSRQITDISSDVDAISAQQITDFKSTKYIFFTPTSYRYGDESVDLGQADISIFDEKKHDLITDHMFVINSRAKKLRRKGKAKKRNRSRKLPKRGKIPLLTTLSVRQPFKKSAAAGEDAKFENAEDYLGSSSPFLSLELGTRRKPLPEDEGPPTMIKKSFAQNRKIKRYNKISLTDQESALLKNKNNIDFSRLPLQFRALVLSNYGLSRFSFALEEEQLLQNPKFSTAINNIFNRVRIARYLDGFEKKDNGLRSMNNPIYRPLDQEAIDSGKTLMIKMSKFNNDILQVEGEDQVPATNTFVAIEGTINPASNTPENPEIQISDREEKEFSTTNIIKQNEKRQELNKFINPIEQVQQSTPTTQRRTNVNRRSTIRTSRGSY
jgi:hypothetical protein